MIWKLYKTIKHTFSKAFCTNKYVTSQATELGRH